MNGNHHTTAMLAGLLGGCVAVTASAGSETVDVQAEIDALRSEINALRAESGQSWLDDTRRAEIEGIVQDVLADSATRTSYQDDASIAGWSKGFRLQSPDGNFLLKVGGQVQIRYVFNHANDVPGSGSYLWGMENRRTKLQFEGHVVDPSWTYRLKGAFARGAGGFMGLDDAWIAKSLGDGVKVKVGQFKAPFMREELVSSSKQLTVERSIVNEYFNQGKSQGIQLSWKSDDFTAAAWAGDGLGARGLGPARFNGQNTAWNETATNYAFAGRGEWKFAGEWSQFKDFSSARGSEFAGMVGVAGAVQRANQTIGAADGTIAGGVTADVTLEFSGASIFASLVWMNVDNPTDGVTNPYGFTVQGGYFVAEDVEAFARYEYMDYDLENVPNRGTGRFNGCTVGANWFLNPAVKFTMDWTINFDSLAAGAFVATSAGFRADEPGASDQWALRAQLQLLF